MEQRERVRGPGISIASRIFPRAWAMARDGSSGVENTFKVLSSPPCIHTQSVNVPPVSMAMRRSDCTAGAIVFSEYQFY